MALTYKDQATLKNDINFRDRISVAVAKYTQFILGNAGATVAQKNWAKSVFASSGFDGTAQKVVFFAIWDAAVTGLTSPVDQAALSDASLQTVVETAINNNIIPGFGF